MSNYLRRSTRLKSDTSEESRKIGQQIIILINQHKKKTHGDEQIINILKVIKLTYLHFNILQNHTFVGLRYVYITSFRFLEELKLTRCKINQSLAIKFHKEIIKYRIKYEKWRRIMWGLDKWKIYLPLEILNHIESYISK